VVSYKALIASFSGLWYLGRLSTGLRNWYRRCKEFVFFLFGEGVSPEKIMTKDAKFPSFFFSGDISITKQNK
jgi:hypothetical protein